MSKRNQERPDGRGRSDGSRRTQFVPGNQAARGRRKRKSNSLPDNAIEAFRKALYQPVNSTKNGKKSKIPFIDALFQKMMADALVAPLHDKIKFYKEIVYLGIMNVEIYRQRIARMAQKYCDEMYDKVIELHVFIDTLGKAYKSAAFERNLYKTAFDICCMQCTCGTAERALHEASEVVLAVAQIALDECEADAFADEDYDGDYEDDPEPQIRSREGGDADEPPG